MKKLIAVVMVVSVFLVGTIIYLDTTSTDNNAVAPILADEQIYETVELAEDEPAEENVEVPFVRLVDPKQAAEQALAQKQALAQEKAKAQEMANANATAPVTSTGTECTAKNILVFYSVAPDGSINKTYFYSDDDDWDMYLKYREQLKATRGIMTIKQKQAAEQALAQKQALAQEMANANATAPVTSTGTECIG